MYIFCSASCGGGGAGAKIRDEGPKNLVPGGYRCRLSWLTSSAFIYETKYRRRGVSANEYSFTQEPK
jgi:hypothetical protein